MHQRQSALLHADLENKILATVQKGHQRVHVRENQSCVCTLIRAIGPRKQYFHNTRNLRTQGELHTTSMHVDPINESHIAQMI